MGLYRVHDRSASNFMVVSVVIILLMNSKFVKLFLYPPQNFLNLRIQHNTQVLKAEPLQRRPGEDLWHDPKSDFHL